MYEPPKAAKERVTTVPSKYKLIMYRLCTSVFEQETVTSRLLTNIQNGLRSRLQVDCKLAYNGQTEIILKSTYILERTHVGVNSQVRFAGRSTIEDLASFESKHATVVLKQFNSFSCTP